MQLAVRIARIGNKIISFLVIVLIAVMLTYGVYSLWDTAMLYRGAYISAELLAFKPSLEKPDAQTFAELTKINPDVCGWLTIDDTHIDYPILQGEDDMEYINQDVYGNFALSGSIFMDSANASDFSDSYTLIYGHHMENGAMFGDVEKFTDSSYFETHKTGTLFTKSGESYEIRIFACIKTDAYDAMIYYPDFQEQGNIGSLLTYIEENAVNYRELDVGSKDSIIGLSTCDESSTNGRIVLFGKLSNIKYIQEGGS